MWWERFKSTVNWTAALVTIGSSGVIAAAVAAAVTFFTSLPLWIVILAAAGAFLMSAGVLASWVTSKFRAPPSVQVSKESNVPAAPPPQVLDQTQTYFKGISLRIIDLAIVDPVLRDKVFEDCHLFGPAVVALSGTVALQGITVRVERPADMLFEVESGRHVLGPIIMHNCTFRRTSFYGIGIMTDAASIKTLLDGFTLRLPKETDADG